MALPAGVSSFDLEFRPSGIVATTGAIWAEDHAATNHVYAIDPESGRTIAELDFGRPCDLAVGFDRVWSADLDRGALIWIDPATREVGGEVDGLHGPCGPQVIGESVWLAVDEGLARVDPTTLEVAITEAGHPTFPGAGEPFWAVDFDTGEHLRIDETNGDILKSIANPGGPALYMPPTSGLGSLWTVNDATNRVYRLDPETGRIQAEIESARPSRVLVASEAVWVTSYDAGVLNRIDPATNKVTTSLPLEGNLNGITEGFGAIWVADTLRGILFRIDPETVAG